MEKRLAERRIVLKPAAIEFAGSTIACMVRNISRSGAALDVSSAIGIPDHFTLALPTEGRHMPCHVVWRNDKRIGIAFDQITPDSDDRLTDSEAVL
jgi:PilZ domain